MTRKQQTDESIAECVHALRKLARGCSSTNVSAEQHREELTRDAFINGLTSSNTRQRLLEEDELDFKTPIDRAEILNNRSFMHQVNQVLFR